MFIREPKTFYDTFKPLLYFNWYVGMGAPRLPNQSNVKYALMKVYTFISTLLNWIMIYVTFNSLPETPDSNHPLSMAHTMYRTLFRVNTSVNVMAPFLVWLRRKAIRECTLRMVSLDDNFQAGLGAPKEYRRQHISLILKIVGVLLAMILVGLFDTLASFHDFPLQLNIRSSFTTMSITHTLHHPILVILVMDVNFCCFIGYLGKKFRDMNNCLLRLTDIAPTAFPGEISRNVQKIRSENRFRYMGSGGLVNDKHRSLRQIRKAHLELCKLSREINSIFGIQNLISTGISFVMITGLSYTIYSAFEWNNFSRTKLLEVTSSVIWTAIYALKIWMVNHSCWCVSNEAGKTGEVIYELLASRVTEDLQKEVQEFGIQMLQNPIQFNACGFFTLDYTFVQGVIGSITTYLVILIQMSHVSDSPIVSTGLASNGTDTPLI